MEDQHDNIIKDKELELDEEAQFVQEGKSPIKGNKASAPDSRPQSKKGEKKGPAEAQALLNANANQLSLTATHLLKDGDQTIHDPLRISEMSEYENLKAQDRARTKNPQSLVPIEDNNFIVNDNEETIQQDQGLVENPPNFVEDKIKKLRNREQLDATPAFPINKRLGKFNKNTNILKGQSYKSYNVDPPVIKDYDQESHRSVTINKEQGRNS